MTDCIFCNIVAGNIPTTILYQNNAVIAFNDLNPQAPIHQLIIPRKHIVTINDLEPEENDLVGQLFQVAKRLAAAAKIDQSGYRLVMNCNQEGGQTVYHLHLHLLGGRPMNWPPG